jgi:hypothetical protein
MVGRLCRARLAGQLVGAQGGELDRQAKPVAQVIAELVARAIGLTGVAFEAVLQFASPEHRFA